MQVFIGLTLNQEIERLQNRQSSFDQRQELLVEYQKLALLDPAFIRKAQLAGSQNSPRLDPVDEVSLLHEPVANLGFRVSTLDLLQHVALVVGDFYQVLSHVRNRGYPFKV